MITVYTIKAFSRSIRAKLQKRDRKGRFSKRLPTAKQVEKNPLATFLYPMSDQPWNSRLRYVRVISATPTHITGLERTNGKWQFKKFLQAKASDFRMQEFNPASMS
jgi:hypothetical protein